MHFIDIAHTLPDFVSHVAASCGLGLAGILGGEATKDARAALAQSRRRQRRLARGAGALIEERDWDDVEGALPVLHGCDGGVVGDDALLDDHSSFYNTKPLDAFEDPALRAFDRRLGPPPPPSASEFVSLDDDEY
jgi:hypothetical protein